MRFEWDARKDRLNQAKHGGIGFEIAIRVFDDPLCLYRVDRNVDGEARWHAIGSVMFGPSRSAVLLVTHAYREYVDGEETIRIISARQAGKDDVRRYQEQEAD